MAKTLTYKFLLAFALLFARSSFASDQPYFNGDDFGQCVVKMIRNRSSVDEIRKRFQKADKIRVQGAKDLLKIEGGDWYGGGFVGKFLALVTPFSQQDATEVMAFHSVPLIDFESFDWGRGMITKNLLDRESELIRKLHDDKVTDLTQAPDFRSILDKTVPPRPSMTLQMSDQSLMVRSYYVAQALSDKFADSLIDEKVKMQKSHFDLLKQTITAYDGDVLTSLGLIGHTFDVERVADGSEMELGHRNRVLFLGSRMKPLFDDSEDPMGDNYHFWLYMNAAMQGKGNQAKIMAYMFQRLTNDMAEYRADVVGLAAGNYIHDHLFDDDVSKLSCKLDKSIDQNTINKPAQLTSDNQAFH